MTSTDHSPAIGGLAGADAICQRHADAASLPGTYRAFLSPEGGKAHERLAGARGWIRTDGRPVLDEAVDFFTGKMRRPILFDENGLRASSTVLTGTVAVVAGGTLGMTCGDYVATTGITQCGQSDAISASAVDATQCSCSGQFRFYCFGIDRSEPLPPAGAIAGRKMFVYPGGLSSGTGLQAFDSGCTSAAIGANLSGTFRALVATTTATAASRFDVTGPPWVRVDGAPVAGMLDGSYLDHTPSVDSTGISADVPTFTGAAAPNVVGTDA